VQRIRTEPLVSVFFSPRSATNSFSFAWAEGVRDQGIRVVVAVSILEEETMERYPFGNDPGKIEGYRAFWNREARRRPLVGFSLKSWFPLEEFAASRAWKSQEFLNPDMVEPEAFLDDQERLLQEGEEMDDDILRGASPSQAVPWLDGMLGAPLRILPGNVLSQEQTLPWEDIARMRLDPENPWYRKYMEFGEALVARSAGRFPVSHGTLFGPTDLLATFRGHTRAVLDLMDEPDRAQEALWKFTYLFQQVTEEFWKRIPLFAGGYFDAQYQLWTPGPVLRLQEDAIAVYSPRLYLTFVQPLDRYLARRFSGCFMHLHSTSMFLLDHILEIEELRCLQVNYEVASGGPDIKGMLPYFRRIQEAGRSLLIRGSFTPEELRLLVDSLDPRGLYLYIMVADLSEVERLRPLVGL